MSPIVLHVPHSALYIPEQERTRILLNDVELRSALFNMTDWYTDVLYPTKVFKSIVSRVSRLVVDVERFRFDSHEPMAKIGQGAVYTHIGDKLLRELDEEYRECLLRTYYDVHHSFFEQAVGQCLHDHGCCLIIDCHSYSGEFMTDKTEEEKPEICIGVDAFHTPSELLIAAKSYIENAGFTVGINTPFSGTIVPNNAYLKQKNVASIMLEIDRSVYMTQRHNSDEVEHVEAMCEKKHTFKIVASFLESLIEYLGDVYRVLR